MKRTLHFFGIVGLVTAAGSAQALEFTIGDIPFKVDNLITVGGVMRMQDRDHSLIGKPNLNRLLGTAPRCLLRTGDDLVTGPNPDPAENTFTGNTCTTSNGANPQTPSPTNILFVADPGSYNINGDDGNLNFDRGDIVHASAKITTDINFTIAGFNVFTRGLYLFDKEYDELVQLKPDTTLIERNQPLSDAARDSLSGRAEVLDYFISRTFEIGDKQFALKVGNQVLNWGESAFLIPNSLNSINPPNQALLRVPGFDIKELFQPVGMAMLSGEAFGLNFEAFYQYEFKPVEVDPVGSFFSVSDVLGEGGDYALLGFAKAPEDPDQLYEPRQNANDPLAVLGSAASRTAYRDYDLERQYAPSDDGQYGMALKYFADWLNGGTELALYYANYHSRFPTISFISSDLTCIVDASSLLPGGGCGDLGNMGATPVEDGDGTEPLPVDTIKLFTEYPEDIQMYGFSFNTTLGDWAFAGEYTYRPNLPVQIHSVDLTLAAISPALPRNNVNLGAAVLPNSRAGSAAFVPLYRNVRNRRDAGEAIDQNDPSQVGYGPNEYIQGYERLKQGQADFTLIKTFGGDNPLGATQIALVLEFGHTYVFDLPELGELQSQGAGTDSHISVGADATTGINPADLRENVNDIYSVNLTDDANGRRNSQPGFRQNPTAQADRGGFGTKESYGYRAVALTRYDSAFAGINIEFLTGFFHDVEGVGPGIGQNFVEGRKQMLFGIRGDYLSKYTGEIRYTWFTGGGTRDALRDRDNLLIFAGYQF